MKLSRLLLLPAVAIAASLTFAGASAAPVSGPVGALKSLPEASSAVEKTYWVTRCHRYHGRVRCHKVWVSPRRHWRRYH